METLVPLSQWIWVALKFFTVNPIVVEIVERFTRPAPCYKLLLNSTRLSARLALILLSVLPEMIFLVIVPIHGQWMVVMTLLVLSVPLDMRKNVGVSVGGIDVILTAVGIVDKTSTVNKKQ